MLSRVWTGWPKTEEGEKESRESFSYFDTQESDEDEVKEPTTTNRAQTPSRGETYGYPIRQEQEPEKDDETEGVSEGVFFGLVSGPEKPNYRVVPEPSQDNRGGIKGRSEQASSSFTRPAAQGAANVKVPVKRKKKMTKRNGFFMYMMERRPQLEAEGKKFLRGWADIANEVGNEWQAMSSEQKSGYLEKARIYNEKIGKGSSTSNQQKEYEDEGVVEDFAAMNGNGDGSGSTLFLGKSVTSSIRTLSPKVEKERAIVLNMFESDDWRSRPIVVASFAFYLDPEIELFCLPAELGLVSFSLTKGVMDNYARVIAPREDAIPLGGGVEAITQNKKLGLPNFGSAPEFENLKDIVDKFERFLLKHQAGCKIQNQDEYYLFALESERDNVKAAIKWLRDQTGIHFPINVLSLSLWAHMACTDKLPFLRDTEGGVGSDKVAIKALNQSKFDYDLLTSLISPGREVGTPLNSCFTYPSRLLHVRFGIFGDMKDVDDTAKHSDNYRYYDELCCVYHLRKGEGTHHCALNAANRYVFSILEVLTLMNEVDVVLGAHYPEVDDSAKEWARRYRMLLPWGLTKLEESMEDPPFVPLFFDGPLPRSRRPWETRGFERADNQRPLAVRERKYKYVNPKQEVDEERRREEKSSRFQRAKLNKEIEPPADDPQSGQQNEEKIVLDESNKNPFVGKIPPIYMQHKY